MSAHLPPVASPPELQPTMPANLQENAILFKTEDDTAVDNVYSEKQQRLFTEPLYSSWSGPGGGQKFLAMANVGLFYAKRKPPIVPDGLLSLGVEVPDDMWARENRSYFTWDYGKSPEVVIEVVSNNDGGELGDKKRIYAEVRVPYYVVWDPENQLGKGPLQAFQLRGEKYESLQDLWFEGIGLGLKIWQGTFEGKDAAWLRWCEKNGEVIPTGSEGKKLERQRADQERQRADRLAAQLRALGVEPD
jgi:Uma2 family endonuclease